MYAGSNFTEQCGTVDCPAGVPGCPAEGSIASGGAENAFLCAVDLEPSICQDRLGANIGKVEGERGISRRLLVQPP